MAIIRTRSVFQGWQGSEFSIHCCLKKYVFKIVLNMFLIAVFKTSCFKHTNPVSMFNNVLLSAPLSVLGRSSCEGKNYFQWKTMQLTAWVQN